MGAGGEVAQAEEPPADSQVATSGTRVVAQGTAVHADVNRLLSGEVARLCLGLPVESVMIYVRHIEDFIT
jgi:hypothetical protein